VGAGGSVSQTFTLTNSGGRATAVLTIALAGAGFTKTADSCRGTSLGPRKSCSVTVRYSPTGAPAGDRATLTATGRRTGFEASLALDGAGAATAAPALTAGAYHTCAAVGGALKCWGRAGDGQLGDGANADSDVPVGVPGAQGASAIAGGFGHTCAVSGGAVRCWGLNFQGQLGNGTDVDSNVPVDVVGLSSGVQAVVAGDGHTCALTSAGAVKCWGWNVYDQLGNGSRTGSNVPVDVSGLSGGVVAIAAGDGHTCALTSAGAVRCWGLDCQGQLGRGGDGYSLVPADVTGLPGCVTAVAAGGAHTCALTDAGAVVCWGSNDSGELGNGATVDSNVPVPVSGLAGVTAIAAGGYHSCALTGGGAVRCWGGAMPRHSSATEPRRAAPCPWTCPGSRPA
jgi:alpha-tubulin suppressor-like RCC1 family protein